MSARRGAHTLHAEEIAINRIGRNKVDTIVVIRLTAADNFTMAHPCSRCWKKIKKAGIKKVIYSNWQGEITTISVK